MSHTYRTVEIGMIDQALRAMMTHFTVDRSDQKPWTVLRLQAEHGYMRYIHPSKLRCILFGHKQVCPRKVVYWTESFLWEDDEYLEQTIGIYQYKYYLCEVTPSQNRRAMAIITSGAARAYYTRNVINSKTFEDAVDLLRRRCNIR